MECTNLYRESSNEGDDVGKTRVLVAEGQHLAIAGREREASHCGTEISEPSFRRQGTQPLQHPLCHLGGGYQNDVIVVVGGGDVMVGVAVPGVPRRRGEWGRGSLPLSLPRGPSSVA